jgi:hypothetical protein
MNVRQEEPLGVHKSRDCNIQFGEMVDVVLHSRPDLANVRTPQNVRESLGDVVERFENDAVAGEDAKGKYQVLGFNVLRIEAHDTILVRPLKKLFEKFFIFLRGLTPFLEYTDPIASNVAQVCV